MKELLDLVADQGLHAGMLDVGSRRGGDTPGHPSRWKVYYRSALFPHLGILVAHEEEDAPLDNQLARLDEEASNYRRLRDAQFEVPATAERSIATVDHLAGGIRAAALVVEHIAGRGPYKARTDFRSIGRIVRSADPGLRPTYLDAWASLSAAVALQAPMDLQLILADDGRIVTIDPERIGPGYQLPTMI